MKKRLEKLRKLPDAEKNNIIKIMAFIATTIIFVSYLFILAFVPNETVTTQSTQQDVMNAFSNVLNNGFDQIENLGIQIQDQSQDIDLDSESFNILNAEIQSEFDALAEPTSAINANDSSENSVFPVSENDEIMINQNNQ
jgi:peptidoglycan hydrolase CwlO-like protein